MLNGNINVEAVKKKDINARQRGWLFDDKTKSTKKLSTISLLVENVAFFHKNKEKIIAAKIF